MLQFTTKLMNMFSYSIITYFIPSNKDYHSCCYPYSVYQTYLKYNALSVTRSSMQCVKQIREKVTKAKICEVGLGNWTHYLKYNSLADAII